MNWQDRIVQDENVMLGKPTIKGTRLTVEHILDVLSQGWTEEQIFESYPRLTRDDLKAVFAYLHESMVDGIVIKKIG